MTSAAELFVITLARASRRARRYLRDLERMDREDVLASAILWCWENRTTYNPSVPLDDWFVGAIRNAKSKWMKGERHEAAEVITDIPAPDDTLARTEVLESAQILASGLDKRARKIAVLTSYGYDQRTIAERLGIDQMAVSRSLKTIRKLRDLIPGNTEFRHAVGAGDSSYNPDEIRPSPVRGIDKEIERLDFPPPSGKECPPCWRCRWYDGFLPAARKAIRMRIEEVEVREAVLETEARKIDIAERIQRGEL